MFQFTPESAYFDPIEEKVQALKGSGKIYLFHKIHLVHSKQNRAAVRSASQTRSVLDRLTDVSLYTGIHLHRFDTSGYFFNLQNTL